MQEHLLKRVKPVYNNNANTQIASVIVKSDFWPASVDLQYAHPFVLGRSFFPIQSFSSCSSGVVVLV
jgi:hypothetical protein